MTLPVSPPAANALACCLQRSSEPGGICLPAAWASTRIIARQGSPACRDKVGTGARTG